MLPGKKDEDSKNCPRVHGLRHEHQEAEHREDDGDNPLLLI